MDNVTLSHNKTLGDLGREALWFTIHSLIAVTVLAVVVATVTLFHPDPDALQPKIMDTVLAFGIPLIVGFIVNRWQQSDPAAYIWIAGLIVFAIVSVHVLDLPTGNGLCERCGATEKLWRTFFDITHGSGLMAGDGLLIGTWIPLSIIGYALGARSALSESE